MSQRIRYKEIEPGIMVSKKVFTSSSTGARYKVVLNLNDVTYKIKNLNTERFVYVGGDNINNLNVLKRTAKATLESRFGVIFDEEVRQRTYGICELGWTQEKEAKKRLEQAKNGE